VTPEDAKFTTYKKKHRGLKFDYFSREDGGFQEKRDLDEEAKKQKRLKEEG
jgi:hypothetical protein